MSQGFGYNKNSFVGESKRILYEIKYKSVIGKDGEYILDIFSYKPLGTPTQARIYLASDLNE